VPFKFELNQVVELRVSEEWGHVKGRAEYASGVKCYYVHYKGADGRAVEAWWDETELMAMEDDRHPGAPVYACNVEDVPKDAVIKE
jgi:hypothetical protein